jgi:hypothetical protein
MTVVAAAAVLLVAATGCGGGSADGPAPEVGATSAQPTEDLGVGAMYFGECGSVSTEEFTSLTGLGGVQLQERNTVGCRWESGSIEGGHGSFSWYRGSPIQRERTLVERVGRLPEDLTVGPMTGYVAEASSLCEVGLASGGDFFLWSVLYPESRIGGDLCGPVEELARLTVERAQ